MNSIMCAIQNEQREPPRSYREGFYFGDVALLSGIKVMSMESRHWERLRYFSSQTPTVALRPTLYVGRLINKVFPRVFKASRAADQVVNTVAWQSICFAMFPSRLFSLSFSLSLSFIHSLIHSLTPILSNALPKSSIMFSEFYDRTPFRYFSRPWFYAVRSGNPEPRWCGRNWFLPSRKNSPSHPVQKLLHRGAMTS